MQSRVKFDISWSAIIKIALAVFLIWFFYAIKEVILLFFIVLVIVAALRPIVDKMAKIMPRALALTLIILMFFAVLFGLGYLIIPPIVSQLSQLSVNLPYLLTRLGPIYENIKNLNYQEYIFNFTNQVTRLSSGIYSTTVGFFSGIIALLTIMVMAFYMLMEQDSIKNFVNQIVPSDYKGKLIDVLKKIGEKMGNWVRGQVLLMVTVGILDGIALVSLDVPYALTLAVWGALTEVIPYIGPWLGLIPAAIIAFTVSPLTALLVVIIYLIVQQLEAQFLAPKIMGKAVGLSPVIIILALLIGAKLMGIMGVIVAVPIAAAISVIIQEWPEIKKIRSL